VLARWPSPCDDCAAMDGIAVRAADLAVAQAAAAPAAPATDDRAFDESAAHDSAPDVSPGDGPADRGTLRLAAGMFEWIDTGDPMPSGLDTVVMRERLLPQADGGVLIAPAASTRFGGGLGRAPAAPGRHVRGVGEDFCAGQLLLPAGRRLRPGDLAAAAAGGQLTVAVTRRPVVAIIPTGDEIRSVGSALHRGDILDTNSLMLAARCRQLGAVPVVTGVVPDNPDTLAAELRRTAAEADLVLVIAGSSRGRGDHAAAVLAQVGGVAVAGIAVRPGHPALLGHAKRQAGIAPVIGLPGYPLATAVIFELFAAPMLAELTSQAPETKRVGARLDRDWDSRGDVEDWVLVTLGPTASGAVPLATPARRGASSISQLARADAWWPIPAGEGSFTAGAGVEVIPVPGTW
jgi:putative molybdopterin biosynthesis protein